jgi:hypothetical protein
VDSLDGGTEVPNVNQDTSLGEHIQRGSVLLREAHGVGAVNCQATRSRFQITL